MSFISLPAGAQPVRLQSAASGVISFLEPTGAGASPIIVLNVVASRDDFGRPNDSPRPRIALIANGALPVTVPQAPSIVTISDGAQDVASASLTVEEPGIYQVVVSLEIPGSVWDVRVTNTGTEALNFTSTVATNENDARQPWIDLPPSVNFRTAFAGETNVAPVHVGNRGSAKLSVRQGAVVTEIDPYHAANIDISFSINDIGDADTPHSVTSNATNNRSIRLQGNVVPKPPPTLNLISITCNTPTDPDGGVDELTVVVGDQEVLTGAEIAQGQTISVEKRVPFSDNIVIRLRELDAIGADDDIGSVIADVSQRDAGPQHITLTGSDSNYVVTIEVI